MSQTMFWPKVDLPRVIISPECMAKQVELSSMSLRWQWMLAGVCWNRHGSVVCLRLRLSVGCCACANCMNVFALRPFNSPLSIYLEHGRPGIYLFTFAYGPCHLPTVNCRSYEAILFWSDCRNERRCSADWQSTSGGKPAFFIRPRLHDISERGLHTQI